MKWTNSYRSFGLKTKRSTGLKTIEHKHAGWPDPETVPEPVDASDRQRRAGPSLAAKKADAAVNIPFTRPNRAASAREPLNSAIASPADCLVSAATAAPVLSLQRRSVSGATPGSPAT